MIDRQLQFAVKQTPGSRPTNGTYPTPFHVSYATIRLCLPAAQVLTPADESHHINKHNFTVPFVCGCRDLGEALRRVAEGAAMIRTKGEAGTGNVVEAVRHCRAVMAEIRKLQTMDEDEVYVYAKELRAPLDLVR